MLKRGKLGTTEQDFELKTGEEDDGERWAGSYVTKRYVFSCREIFEIFLAVTVC